VFSHKEKEAIEEAIVEAMVEAIEETIVESLEHEIEGTIPTISVEDPALDHAVVEGKMVEGVYSPSSTEVESSGNVQDFVLIMVNPGVPKKLIEEDE